MNYEFVIFHADGCPSIFSTNILWIISKLWPRIMHIFITRYSSYMFAVGYNRFIKLFGTCMKSSGSFLHTSGNDLESISCQFQKMVTVTAHCLCSQILYCHTHEAPWSYSFALRRFRCHSETTEKHVFSRLALSVTCTDTPRLSGDDCLQDDGMLEPSILRSRVAAHFSFHGDTGLNLRKHYHVLFTARGCLCSHHQGAMSKWCGVYTRVTRLRNRFQTACAISWSIPWLCAISANTGRNHLRGHAIYPADPVCRPTPDVAGESPSSTDKLVSMPSQKKNSQVSISPTHCWMSFSPGRKCWICVGWNEPLISSSASAAFRSHQICNGLIWISCRCGFSPWTTFMHVLLAPWEEYAQPWFMHKEDTLGTDFVTDFVTTGKVSFQQPPRIQKMLFASLTNHFGDYVNFQSAICHGWCSNFYHAHFLLLENIYRVMILFTKHVYTIYIWFILVETTKLNFKQSIHSLLRYQSNLREMPLEVYSPLRLYTPLRFSLPKR